MPQLQGHGEGQDDGYDVERRCDGMMDEHEKQFLIDSFSKSGAAVLLAIALMVVLVAC